MKLGSGNFFFSEARGGGPKKSQQNSCKSVVQIEIALMRRQERLQRKYEEKLWRIVDESLEYDENRRYKEMKQMTIHIYVPQVAFAWATKATAVTNVTPPQMNNSQSVPRQKDQQSLANHYIM